MAQQTQRRTILIATATHAAGLLISKFLQPYLHSTTCLVYISGVDVLDALTRLDIDLIITDDWLSDMHAYDFGQAIKGAHPQLPVILLTTLATAKIQEGIQRGLFDGVLIKPLHVAEASNKAVAISA